ncbi:TlpA family protein disulfide reductase [Methyloprofundus sp.]|uniref:TlpA family protein disulfide reductase n=1 Tax=Methyloprofundus sp. TaxID=2020875 RepID=UPI003D143AA3
MPKPFIALIAITLLISTFLVWENSLKPAQAQPTITLPEFSLPDLAGTIHPISEWHGKILVINFWATWCPPCLKEIPEFIELQAEYAEQNVQFIGIAIDDADLVADYLSFSNINYPVLIAESEGAELSQKLGNTIKAIPFTALVNRQQEIIFYHPGELSKQRLQELIIGALGT